MKTLDLPTTHQPASKPRLIPFSTHAHRHPRRRWRLGRRARQRMTQLRQVLLATVEAGS